MSMLPSRAVLYAMPEMLTPAEATCFRGSIHSFVPQAGNPSLQREPAALFGIASLPAAPLLCSFSLKLTFSYVLAETPVAAADTTLWPAGHEQGLIRQSEANGGQRVAKALGAMLGVFGVMLAMWFM